MEVLEDRYLRHLRHLRIGLEKYELQKFNLNRGVQHAGWFPAGLS